MSITRPNALIPYFMAYYLIHYSNNLKTTCDRQKQIVDLESTSKQKKNID